MAAKAKSDQLVDILLQIQSRKTVKPEDASKALTQYYKVQDHIKELKEEIEVFKKNQVKKQSETKSPRRSNANNGYETPRGKASSRVLNGSTSTLASNSASRSPSRVLNGPTYANGYNAKQDDATTQKQGTNNRRESRVQEKDIAFHRSTVSNKSPTRVLNGPAQTNGHLAKQDTVSNTSPTRVLNGPNQINGHLAKQDTISKAGTSMGNNRRESKVSEQDVTRMNLNRRESKVVEKDVVASNNYDNEKDKDSELARLRFQNAQLKIAFEQRLSSLPTAAQSIESDRPKGAELGGLPNQQKIIQDFRKIYDQEWRSALHDMEKHYKMKEENITELLAGIAKEAYIFCQAVAKQQFDDMTTSHSHVTDVIIQPRYIVPHNKGILTSKSKAIIDKGGYIMTRKYLKDYRKAMARVPISGLVEIFEDIVQKEILARHTTLRITPKVTRPYIHHMIEVVWFMSISDSPIQQIWQRPGQLMSREQFNCYSKKGATILHTVWPALVSQKDGLLIEKGVCLVK